MKIKLILTALLILIAITPALAQDQPAKPWMLGIGGSYSDGIYRGIDSEFSLLPLISYRGERFFLQGPKLGYKIFKGDDFSVALIGNYRMQGYDSGDSPYLSGMSDRDSTLEAGATATWDAPFGKLQFGILSDLQDNHGGYEIKLSLSKRYRYGRFSVVPTVAALWQSSDMSDYYYGVTTAQATTDRSAYEAEGALIYRGGVSLNYMLTDNWVISSRISAELYPDEISNSPIVEDDFSTSGLLGLGYRF
jgi:MipA family protein